MKKRWLLSAVFLLLLMGVSLYFLTTEADAEFVFSDQTQETSVQAAAPWTYPISLEILEDPLDIMRLVNRDNLLEKDYPPKDDPLYTLVNAQVTKSSSSELLIRETAHDALIALFDAAKADGLTLVLDSTYRKYSTQATMYENRLKNIGRDDGVVQMPGASEHQTGLAMDIINKSWIGKKYTTDFADTAEGQWMAENCARFGFIIRYPKDKKDITGIIYEPWHLRYVGVEVATYMTGNNLSLEEFTAQWRHALAAYVAQSGGNVDLSKFNF